MAGKKKADAQNKQTTQYVQDLDDKWFVPSNLKAFSNTFDSLWLSYLGDSINQCGNIRFTKQAFYDIHKNNTLINSYYRKIEKMVAKYGFKVVDQEGEIVNDTDMVMQIKNFLSVPTFDKFKQEVFTQAFCAGQVFSVVGKENFEEQKVKILDCRGMSITTDQYGDPVTYNYGWRTGTSWDAERYTPENLLDFMVYYDHDIPYQGISLYQSILTDAMTEAEAGKTNFYFFKNRARPDMLVMLTDDLLRNKEELENFKIQFKDKYSGSNNSGKPILSWGIADVKTLNISNNDMQLLDLRKFIDTKVAIVFGLDKRLIWYNVETGWSRAEIDSVSQIQGNVKIGEYADILNDIITELARKFVYPDGSFDDKRVICINDKFSNVQQDMKTYLELVKNGVISREEFRVEFDMPVDVLPEEMSRFTISSNDVFIDAPNTEAL